MNQFDFVSTTDKPALLAFSTPEWLESARSALSELGYKVHLGLFEDDILLKLATYSYNIVVIYENFKGASAGENPILKEMVRRASSLRREHFVVLLTQRNATNDAMGAFVQSVDQTLTSRISRTLSRSCGAQWRSTRSSTCLSKRRRASSKRTDCRPIPPPQQEARDFRSGKLRARPALW